MDAKPTAFAELEHALAKLRESRDELALKQRIADLLLSAPAERLYADVLDVVLETLDSPVGYFGYIDDGGALVCPSMTRQVWDRCAIPDKNVVFPRASWGGLFGRSLIEKRALVSNEALNPPVGHVPIERALLVPILLDNNLIGQLAVANRSRDYTHDDQRRLEMVAAYIAPFLRARLEKQRAEAQHRRAQELLRAQRDLGVAISAAAALDDVLRLCVDTAIRVSEMDCGGIYLVDEATGGLDLVVHEGLPSEFVDGATHYDADSVNARLVMAGQPIYTRYAELLPAVNDVGRHEGLRAIAVVPIRHAGRVIACLNIASHALDEVPNHARIAIEAIAGQVGDAVSRAQAAEAEQQARINFQTLFDSVQDYVFVLDLAGCILDVNAIVLDGLGYSKDELVGQSVLKVHPPDRHAEAAAIIADMVAGTTGSCPVPLMTKDGTAVPVETIVTPGSWDGREVFFGVSRDITERKRAEDALRQSEERYRLLADHTDDVVSLNGANGERLYVSPSIERLTGWTPTEALTVDWRTLIHTDDLPAVEQARAANLRGERTTVEYRLRCKNGEFIWLELKATPLRGPTVEVQNTLCASRDVTERRRAETALLRERRLFIGGPTVVFRWVAAEGWPVEYVSPNVEGVFGYRTEDFVSGRVPFASVIHPEDLERVAEEVAEHTRAGVPSFEQEYRIVRPDDQIRWLLDFTVVVRDEEGAVTHYEGYVFDVTDRKSAEASLRDSERRYRTMVHQSPLSIVIYEPDGTPQAANPAFCKLWGVSEQDYQFLLANYNVLEDEALEDLGITAYLRRAFRGEPVAIPEELYDPADSTVASQTGLAPRRIRAYAYPVTDEDGHIREVVLIHEDVTAQRQAEADQARLATAIDQAREAVVVTDAGGAIQYVNPAFEQITGIRARRPSARTRVSSRAGSTTRSSIGKCGTRSRAAIHGAGGSSTRRKTERSTPKMRS